MFEPYRPSDGPLQPDPPQQQSFEQQSFQQESPWQGTPQRRPDDYAGDYRDSDYQDDDDYRDDGYGDDGYGDDGYGDDDHQDEESVLKGAHLPLADRNRAPRGYPIKGDASTGRFYMPDDPGYASAQAEIWFDTPTSARASGFFEDR
jgi:hypothetical protein